MVSPGYSAVQTEKALAEDTPRRECPHDVVELHAHKGTMWMSNDDVPLKNAESPYGGGVPPLLGAAGVCTPATFPVTPVLLAEGPLLGPWQVAVVRVDETPAGDSSGQDSPCVSQNRHQPMDIYELPDSLAHTVVEGDPVGPEVTEPLALLVLDHADLVGQHAAIQNATSALEHLPAQPEPSLGGVTGQLPDSLTHTVVEGGPVGPDVTEPLALLVLDHADLVGQHAAIPYEHVGASTCTAGTVPRWRQDLGRGADGTSCSRHYPGQSTYGGDHSPGASGSESVSGQWTHGGDIVSGAIGAVDSSIIVDCILAMVLYSRNQSVCR